MWAGYIKGDFSGEGVRGDMGVRLVKTQVESSGYNWDGDWVAASISMLDGYSLLAGAVDSANEGNWNVRYATVDHEYTDVLPNLNLVFDVAEDTLLRFSAARVMSRPDYVNIANQQSTNTVTLTGSRGNPMLDPVVTNSISHTSGISTQVLY